MIRDHVLIWDNLLTTSTVCQALTGILQIMPLFFFAGARRVCSGISGGSGAGIWPSRS